MTSNTKLLSFCFFGRNDNYTPDFLYRLSTTINFISHSAQIAGKLEQVEIIVVDWASEKKLKDHVKLAPNGASITRFIYVPKHIAQQYSEDGFPGNICANIGLRRASGKLIGVCGAEVLIPSSSILSLCNLIEGTSAIKNYEQNLYVCGRYRLPAEWVMAQPSIEQWQRYLELNSWRITQEFGRGSFLTGNAGLFLIPRRMLHRSQGLLEALDPYWGWNDVEFTMRALSKFSCIDLNSSGVSIYDMEHFKAAGDRQHIVKKSAPRLLSQQFAANGEQWGAGNLSFEESLADSNFSSPCKQLPSSIKIEIPEDRLYQFSLWIADNLVDLPSENELKLLKALFSKYANRNLLFFKEYGMTKGHSFYLMGFLFKYAHLVGIDGWKTGGGEHGVDHIAYNLTTSIMEHMGHLRLINTHLLENEKTELSSLENEHLDGLVIYRIEEHESLNEVMQVLEQDIALHNVVFVGNSMETLLASFSGTTEVNNFSPLVEGYAYVINQAVERAKDYSDSISFMNSLILRGANLSSLNYEQLIEILAEIKETEVVIWGDNALASLVIPQLNTKEIYQVGKHNFQKVSQPTSAKILRTF